METLKIFPYHSIGVSYHKYEPHLTNEKLTTDTATQALTAIITGPNY